MLKEPSLHRHAVGLALISIVLCLVCAHIVRSLDIYSDFKRMLPQHYPSVRALERIEQRVQSTSTLQVLIGGTDWPSARRFIDDFVVAVEQQLPEVIDRVEYNATVTQRFFERHKFLFLSLEDLGIVRDRLQQRIDFEKFRRTPFAVEIAPPPPLDFSDIEDRYKQQAIRSTTFREGYFTNADATLAIVVLKPRQGATDVVYSKALMAQVRAVAQSLHPTAYHPSIQVGFGGRYPKVVTEFSTVVDDMVRTLVLCALLVGGVVWLYFRYARMVVLMVSTAGLGTLMALASAEVAIGYLTAQTAFLGSIILGNGINYSLILMARYLEERRRGLLHLHALQEALRGTWRPTLASAFTTVVGFAALSVTNIRGLSQFAFIGSVGVCFCWGITYLFLPAWLHLSERWFPLRQLEHRTLAFDPFLRVMHWLAGVIQSRTPLLLKGTALSLFIAIASVLLYLPHILEYNFDNLRFRPATTDHSWEFQAREQIRSIFGESGSPNVIVMDRIDQAKAVCAAIESKAAGITTADGKPILERCKTLFSYIPEQQPEKLALLAEIRAILKNVPTDAMTKYQERLGELRQTATLQPITLHDLPLSVREIFREQNGQEGLIAYVYPSAAINLWDGLELVKFTNLLRTISFSTGETIHSSGELVIFADLLDAVIHEAPKVVSLSFGLVLVVVWFTFRRHAWAAAIIMGSLTLGTLWMLALFPAGQVKLNFVNFVALPITFGIGVDYAVNIYGRYAQEGEGSIRHVLTHVGGAVVLCSITTIIGYAVLLISHNLALVSLGMAALLGEIACLLAAVVVMPTFFQWREQRKRLVPVRQSDSPAL